MTACNCPTSTVISAPAWKHWTVAFVGTLIGSGVLLAGLTWPDWGPNYGPGLARLLKTTSSPIVTWLYSLVLFTTAQGAALILWARSRSERDFHGNYRIWGWAAATWLFFSFAVATQAHVALSETVLFHIRWKTNGAALWCWLLPAVAWGWGIGLRLEPELRTDRSGHFLFLAAGGWYMAVAGVLCQQEFWPKVCPAQLSVLLAALFQLLGHSSLFLSTSLHARYVLLFSAEPPLIKRRAAKSAIAAEVDETQPPRRWLSMLSWSRRTSADDSEEADDGKPKRGKKRAVATTTKKRATARKTTRRSKTAEDAAEADESEGWENDEGTESDESGTAESGAEQKNYRFDAAEDSGDADDSDDNDSGEFKGLSKKERRRLQQQMREEERKAR
ncbi:MAG: hypothetical protein JWN70_5919 [Planctomycetaceae bacterium]|nr:hypothetical protein [Planctomycetaceae bacterium]